ncbi:hypothetical protein RUND412_004974 [Rhizina undulata]
MVTMFLVSFGLACLSALTSACPLPTSIQEDSPLVVELIPSSENAVITATITNSGATDLKLLNLGTILTDGPVEKVDVFLKGQKLAFKGIYYSYFFDNLDDSAFTLLPAGGSIQKNIELAGLYDFTTSGPYKIVAQGALPFIYACEEPSTFDKNAPPAFWYQSKGLSLEVDVELAQKVPSLAKPITERVVATGCSGSNKTALINALAGAVTYAKKASTAAKLGSEIKFNEYFNTTSNYTRYTVSTRFSAVASAASSNSTGQVSYYCSDPYGYCRPNVIAYTVPTYNTIANCDIFYTLLPAVTSQCHGQDRIGTVMHELTHASAVVNPWTKDYAYGYWAAVQLSAQQAVQNADTYALYGQAINLSC